MIIRQAAGGKSERRITVERTGAIGYRPAGNRRMLRHPRPGRRPDRPSPQSMKAIRYWGQWLAFNLRLGSRKRECGGARP